MTLVWSLSLLFKQPIIWQLEVICFQDIFVIKTKPTCRLKLGCSQCFFCQGKTLYGYMPEALPSPLSVLFCQKKCNVDTQPKASRVQATDQRIQIHALPSCSSSQALHTMYSCHTVGYSTTYCCLGLLKISSPSSKQQLTHVTYRENEWSPIVLMLASMNVGLGSVSLPLSPIACSIRI